MSRGRWVISEPNRVADARRDVELSRSLSCQTPRTPTRRCSTDRRSRAAGQRSQAVAVLEQATIAHSGNKALLAGYGRALADNGNFQKAFDVLSRAHTPDDPDWRILSVQGTALDQLLADTTRPRQYLCECAEDRARRTFSAVQSRPFVRRFQKICPKRRRPCVARHSSADADPSRAAEFGAGGWPAGPCLPRPKAL